MGVCICGFCKVWVCVCVDFVIYGCASVWILQSVGLCICGFCEEWVCVCVDFVKSGCVYV